MIDHPTYDDTIRRPWHVHVAHHTEGLDADEDILFGKRPSIDTEPAELDEAKHETEGAAVFIVGLGLVVLAAFLGLWLSRTFGGPM